MLLPFAFLSVLILGSLLPAQTTKTTVAPAVYAAREGNSLDQRPFGYDRVRLTQLVGKSQLSGLPLKSTITALAYRRDGVAFKRTILARRNSRGATTPIWTIRMGNLDISQAPFRVNGRQVFTLRRPPSAYFRPGTGANTLATVFYGKKVSFPNLAPPTSGTAPFTIKFPLDVPFVYLGPSGLAIDHYAYESRANLYFYYVDAARDRSDFGTVQLFGSGCPAGANRASAVPTFPGSGLPFSLLLFGARPNSTAIAFFGASKVKWGALPLPFPLGALGLKGCSLYTGMELLFALPTNASGSVEWAFKLPPDRNLAGARVFAQWLAIDTRVNPAFPLAFSNGVDVTLGRSIGSLEGSLIYGVNLVQTVNGRFGLTDPGVALVTRFTYR